MDPEERHEMRENHRAEILLPTGKAAYCGNCCEPIEGEEANFNWHTYLLDSPITIQKTYCIPCIPEVIAYRYKMRNVGEITQDLPAVKKRNKVIMQKAWEKAYDELPGRVKHI